MKNFFNFILIILIMAFCAVFAFLLLKKEPEIYENWQTKSNLYVIPENTEYDLLIMGGSQARNLSYGVNYLKTKKILNKDILNIARFGEKAGVKQQRAYLTYFYERKNKAQKIIYFLMPWSLYSAKFNEKNIKTFEDEPFEKHFLIDLCKTGVNKDIIFHYLISGLKNTLPSLTNSLETDSKIYNYKSKSKEIFIKTQYPDGINEKNFQKYSQEVEEIIRLAKKYNSEVIFIIQPSLIDDIPGLDRLKIFLKKLKFKYNTKYYDYSNAVTDRNMYRDAVHLNTKGVVYFIEHCLSPLINSQDYRR